jgi:hypothetical protein
MREKEVDRLFRGVYCLHHQGGDEGTSKSSVYFCETFELRSPSNYVV